MNEKVNIARLSVLSNSLLIVLKVVSGLLSGSVSIISEAIHSGMDLMAAVIAFFSVRISDNPPDKRHPYGHGKFENISGVIEALLILGAAGWIVLEALRKFKHPEQLESLGLGMMVMAVSALVNIFVSRRLYKVARLTNSVALEADALHLKTDVYTSAGVAVGLGLILLTGKHIIDPLIAIFVALLIVYESVQLLKKAFFPLVDVSWHEEDIVKLESVLHEMRVKYHDLKTRNAGNHWFVDFHIELPAEISLEKAHDLCDQIETSLESRFTNLQVNIHAEPLPDRKDQ
jgi:cation diffusion facilitator family transporter